MPRFRKAKGADLAYTAGIIDGEGCIGIYPQQKKWFRLNVTVSNTNEWLIQWFKFNYGGHITSYPEHGTRKDKWVWEIWTKQAGKFLELIIPYLKIKKPQAELAIRFQQQKHCRGAPHTDKEKALEEVKVILMHKYNKRGISKDVTEI